MNDNDEYLSSRYSDEGIRQGIQIAIAGGRPNQDEDTTTEDRLLRLIRIVEVQMFQSGQQSVRNQITKALGIK